MNEKIAAAMIDALRAVVGRGYCEQRHPAGQDLVSKAAIAEVWHFSTALVAAVHPASVRARRPH